MGAKTEIEWTDSTWNPIRGCSRVSEGCRHCYAEMMAARFSQPGLWGNGLAVMQNGQPHWTGKVELVEKHLLDPLKWKPCHWHDSEDGTILGDRPRKIFVNSVSDCFHENLLDEARDRIFAVMSLCPHHIFQVLTKRPDRMLKYLGDRETALRVWRIKQQIWQGGDLHDESLGLPRWRSGYMLPNVWQGVSVENQAAADERIPLLLSSPAAVRFVSCEPLLGPVWFIGGHFDGIVDWVIAGGESGRGARSMHPDWARSLRDQCTVAGVPFFFKQWGEWTPTTDPKVAEERGIPLRDCMSFVGKKAAGCLLDGQEHKAFPAVQA